MLLCLMNQIVVAVLERVTEQSVMTMLVAAAVQHTSVDSKQHMDLLQPMMLDRARRSQSHGKFSDTHY